MSNNNLVLIDNVNIASEYGFYLTQRELSAPAVKEEYIDVPGAHGSYDATEAMGAVFYADRNLDRKSTRLNSSHIATSRMPSSA